MEIFDGKSTRAERALALKSAQQLEAILAKQVNVHANGIHIRVAGSQEEILIPSVAFGMMAGILAIMSKGMTAAVVSNEQELSTQAAAGFLNVSRPHLVKLLETNQIPFKKVGSHRRILFRDIQAFSEKRKQEQAEALAFLSQQAQELKMGYE